MTRYVLYALAAIVGFVLIVVIVGWSLPVSHTASGSITVRAPAESVFALISKFPEYPRWRSGVTRIEVIPDAGPFRFREHGPDGTILFEVEQNDPPTRLVTRIADPGLPFGGRWIYEVRPAGAGTELRITEEGEVYNPVFRIVSRFLMGHDRTVKRYLGDVERALAESGSANDNSR
ncbi:MAG TPA: SRPBCC family protein [Gemmatimonadaceae bacterium]|nr:SRPBCC family protein [Gemmatimonadaceae bacterium]